MIPQNLEMKQSPIHGFGIFARQPIKAGQFLGEFVGKKFSWKDFMAIYGRDYRHTYRSMRTHTIISAKEDRNWITYINESATPNVILKSFGCYCSVDISSGEELTLNYGKYYPRTN